MFKFNTQKIKYFISGVIVSGLLTSTIAFADISQIKLTINGKQIQSDVAPQMINGRVFVPVRLVSENLGAKVDWDSVNNTVVISGSDGNKNKIASGASYPSSQPIIQDVRDRVQDMEQENTTVTQTQTQVQQSKPEYEVLKDYPGSYNRYPIRYNGNIYLAIRDGMNKYNIPMDDINYDADKKEFIFTKTNMTISINDKYSVITIGGISYIKESIFENYKNIEDITNVENSK